VTEHLNKIGWSTGIIEIKYSVLVCIFKLFQIQCTYFFIQNPSTYVNFPPVSLEFWETLFKGYVSSFEDTSYKTIWDNFQHHGNLMKFALNNGYAYYCCEPSTATKSTLIKNIIPYISGFHILLFK